MFTPIKPLRLKLAGLNQVCERLGGGNTNAGYDSIPQSYFKPILNIDILFFVSFFLSLFL